MTKEIYSTAVNNVQYVNCLFFQLLSLRSNSEVFQLNTKCKPAKPRKLKSVLNSPSLRLIALFSSSRILDQHTHRPSIKLFQIIISATHLEIQDSNQYSNLWSRHFEHCGFSPPVPLCSHSHSSHCLKNRHSHLHVNAASIILPLLPS